MADGSGRARGGMIIFAHSLHADVIVLSLAGGAGVSSAVPTASADDSSIYIYGAVLPVVPDLGSGKPSDNVPGGCGAPISRLTDVRPTGGARPSSPLLAAELYDHDSAKLCEDGSARQRDLATQPGGGAAAPRV
jgi:hypothetical protein